MTKREIKFVSIGGVAAVLLLGYFFGVRGYLAQLPANEAELEQKKNQLKQYQTVLNRGATLPDELELLKDRLEMAGESLLPGDSPSLASAELQKIVNQIAIESEIELKTIKPLSKTNHNWYVGLPLEVNFRDDIEAVVDFLFELETYEISLVLSELTIRVFNEKQPETVDVRMKVMGFIKNAEAEGQE